MVVKEKLHKLHKLQEVVAGKFRMARQHKDKVDNKHQDELAKHEELLQEGEKKRESNLRNNPAANRKDSQDMNMLNRQDDMKVKEAEKMSVQKMRRELIEEPFKLRAAAVAEVVERCVLQQKENLLNVKNMRGIIQANRSNVDFDDLFNARNIETEKTSVEKNDTVSPENKADLKEKKAVVRKTEEAININQEERRVEQKQTDMKVNSVTDIRDCESGHMVMYLDHHADQELTKTEPPFSPNTFFSALSREAKKICTSLKTEGRVRGKSHRGDQQQQQCSSESKEQNNDNSRIVFDQTLGSCAQPTTCHMAPTDRETKSETPGRQVADDSSSTTRDQQNREEAQSSLGGMSTIEQQRREDVRSSLGGMLLIVLVLWLVLETPAEISNKNAK